MMNETNALNLGGTLIFGGSIGDRKVEEKVSVNMASAMAVVVGGAAGEHETLG
jgi:hypothetical protein